MTIHFLNGFTFNARVPSSWRSGTLCLLIETSDGLVLVDTGPGAADYAHKPQVVLHDDAADRWINFMAIRLPLEPEMWLVPLIGHTRGHCGGAIRTDSGWLFHVGDAAPMGFEVAPPSWFVSMVLGPHTPRLRQFKDTHAEVQVTTGHMLLDFFRTSTPPR